MIQVVNSQVAQTKNTKVRSVWDKRDLCLYCFQDVTNFSRHLIRRHSSKFAVKEFLALEKGSIERSKLINVIRKQGNFLSPASHIIRPVRRTKRNLNPTSVISCEYCRGYFQKNYLRHHVEKCSLRPEKKIKFKASRSQTLLASSSASSTSINQLCLKKEIFDTMHADDVSLTAKIDPLICSFGEQYMQRHKHKHLNTITKNKIRELAKLLIEAKNHLPVESLYELMVPENYDLLVMSTKNLAGYDPVKREYKKASSLALHMGTLLQQVCKNIYSLVLKKKEEFIKNIDVPQKVADVKALLKLVMSNWNNDVSSVANQDLVEKAAGKPTIIPLTTDIKLLNDYCKAEVLKYYQVLKSNLHDKKAYIELQNSCYVLTLTLNRKRVGELQRVLLKRYTQANTNIITPEYLENLSDTEKIMYNAFKRVLIEGKRHVTVPLLFARLTQKYLDLLIQIRPNFIPPTI